MSALSDRRAAHAARPLTLGDRVLSAVPLASIYIWLCGVYAFEAWRRVTPWLFSDELELTQLSRSFAATGHATGMGHSHGFKSLYTYVLSPVWLIHDTLSAYSAAKYVDVLVMAAVVFPAYGLARTVVGRRPALFAAAAAAVIPSLAYSSYLVEETCAYPWSVLCFWLIARSLTARTRTPRRTWTAVAVAASLIAPAVRGELLMIPVAFFLTALAAVWSSDWGKARRAAWSTGDWIGFVVLLLGLVFVLSAVGSHASFQWLAVTRLYKHRAIVLGNWAAGAVAIGIGVVPLIAGLAALVRAPGERPSLEVRMFRCLSLGGIVSFALYTGMKAAWLSSDFATRVEERNLLYISPLLFVGTALVLERRRVNLFALAAASAYALYLVVGTPFYMDRQLYSDALGLAILEQANRFIAWTPQIAQDVLLGITVGGSLMLLGIAVARSRPRLVAGATAALGVFVVGWSLTGEIAAAAGTNSLSRAAAATLREPFAWVDAHTHGQRTAYWGEAITDPTAPYLLSFWNRSVVAVGTLDGSLTDQIANGAPNLEANGDLFATYYPFVVEDWPCVDFVGTNYWAHQYRAGGTLRTWRLVEMTSPNRLRSMCTGIYADGWSGPGGSTYFRFFGPAGWLRIDYSRKEWSFPTGPSHVRFQLGTLLVNANRQALFGHVTAVSHGTIDTGETHTEWIRVPAGPFAVRIAVQRLIVPNDWNHAGDKRRLGAQITYRFVRTKPSR